MQVMVAEAHANTAENLHNSKHSQLLKKISNLAHSQKCTVPVRMLGFPVECSADLLRSHYGLSIVDAAKGLHIYFLCLICIFIV